MNGIGSPMKDACGPCLSEKQMKKQREEEAKEIKATLNFLSKNYGFDEHVAKVMGNMVAQLIRIQGPLK